MNKLQLKDIDFIYPKSDKIILKNLNISFKEANITSIMGKSGAGKSTLLYLISGFSKPNSGQIIWNDEEIKDLEAYRRDVVGTISQSYMLFSSRTVLENVEYPLILKGTDKNTARKKAEELLTSVAIGQSHYNKLPEKLSGGEKQRVAIARCLASDSKIIVADEPTGNLDQENTDEIINLFKHLAYENNKIIIIVTHDKNLAEQADSQYELINGNLNKIDV